MWNNHAEKAKTLRDEPPTVRCLFLRRRREVKHCIAFLGCELLPRERGRLEKQKKQEGESIEREADESSSSDCDEEETRERERERARRETRNKMKVAKKLRVKYHGPKWPADMLLLLLLEMEEVKASNPLVVLVVLSLSLFHLDGIARIQHTQGANRIGKRYSAG